MDMNVFVSGPQAVEIVDKIFQAEKQRQEHVSKKKLCTS